MCYIYASQAKILKIFKEKIFNVKIYGVILVRQFFFVLSDHVISCDSKSGKNNYPEFNNDFKRKKQNKKSRNFKKKV